MLVKFLEKSMAIVYQGLPDFLRKWLFKSDFFSVVKSVSTVKAHSPIKETLLRILENFWAHSFMCKIKRARLVLGNPRESLAMWFNDC